MASGADVLNMLLPDGKFIISGNEYEAIIWFDDNKVTKKQFEDGFAQYDAWKATQDATQFSAKSALLSKLGITDDEAKLLLS